MFLVNLLLVPIFFIMFFPLTMADMSSQELNNKLQFCADKNDVGSDLIDRFMSPYFDTDLQEEKCFIMCVGMSLGYVNKVNGRIIKLEKLPEYMQPGAKSGKCLNISGRNPCDTAYLQFTCITAASSQEPGSLDYAEQGFVDY